MNKDVIYIDIEDDITAIIGKVKDAGSKIVALVPPKRAGVLQSLVNIKLLKKAADVADKRIVLITSDHSLTALAAGLKVPVAKNLQSRPEVPEMTAPETDEEEVINGADLPVGEVATAMGASVGTKTLADMSSHVDLKDAPKASDLAVEPVKKPVESFAKKMSGLHSKLKIPDFNTFRTKFFLFGGIGVVVVVFLVWALAFAPHATIKISAQTVAVNVDQALTLDPKVAASDTATMVIKPNVQQVKKSVATTFDATGKKDVGNKASGTINIRNCDSSGSFDIAAGSTFTASSGHRFVSNARATVPGYSSATSSACNSNPSTHAGKVSVAVTAIDLGDEYNIAPTSFSVNVPVELTATSSEAMAGGTHQMATVVSQEDVDKAKAQIADPGVNDVKNDLKKQFVGDFLIIEDSFASEVGNPTVEPAVGQPAQQAKVTIETTYTYVGINREDIKTIAGGIVNIALQGRTDQQMYSLGDNAATFQSFRKLEAGTFTGRISGTAYIGPKIDTKALAEQITGKRFGEIQTIINQIPGVNKVEIDLSPFWVNTAPSVDKIDMSFSVANGS